MESKQAPVLSTEQQDLANPIRRPAMPGFRISPPLLNSANPWATTKEDLRALYDCPYTGAVTVRTSLLKGFPHDPAIHQYTFFSAAEGHATTEVGGDGRITEIKGGETSSLNTLGYSPIPLDEYISIIADIVASDTHSRANSKPFIVSVTGTAEEVAECYVRLVKVRTENPDLNLSLMMEVNLSCPNIPDKPPPAYDGLSLSEYIRAIGQAKAKTSALGASIHVGIKTPPYTYQGQYNTLVHSLEKEAENKEIEEYPISFITATNTLGSCLVVDADSVTCEPALAGKGIGGLAGDAIHTLALGNVKTIRSMLDTSKHASLNSIAVIGVGGVSTAAGFRRMRYVGAAAVAVGTALGREGIPVFEKISTTLSEKDLTVTV
ncbi:Dihydroorotate dehydrogenase (fumarate) [Phlyctema vagabunda]|uniref:Dihydroorotate dehydrogenase (fumarate) n=1 Tax=Phlyctema vagabunda TaxID=108571 RepID=A0ABR4PXK4_9HELO